MGSCAHPGSYGKGHFEKMILGFVRVNAGGVCKGKCNSIQHCFIH